MKLTVSHATRPKAGEVENGDAIVARVAGERGLLAVIDGLGHGPAAAAAAARAVRCLESVSLEEEIRVIVVGLHAALRNTRGAAAMVCRLATGGDDPGGALLEGCGVGNVELRTSSKGVPVVLSPGVLGAGVRQLRVFRGSLPHHSRLVLFSDGISARFTLDEMRLLSPAEACGWLMANHARAHDDATALVADYG